MLRTDRMNVTPLNEPATAVVVGMDTGNVDTVLIAGRVMKQKGKLLHVDWPAVKRMAGESRDHVLAKAGFKARGIWRRALTGFVADSLAAWSVGERGLEPPRGCPHRILNPARLPIPPL